MNRVLFVDDEPRILEGLQRMLRGQRREWDMAFISSGADALAALADRPFDVIVSDMRMPGMDGAALLSHVRERSPATIRIILSGHSDEAAAVRATRVAHLFLIKPSGADVIRDVVGSALRRAAMVSDPLLREALGRVEAPPSHPTSHAHLVAALAAEPVPLDEVVEILGRDPAACAKVLQLVNSSFFGWSRPIASIKDAAEMLGVHLLRRLVLEGDLLRALRVKHERLAAWAENVFAHSVAVSFLAGELCENPEEAEAARTAGLLHDVGKLVLANELPERYGAVVDAARERRAALDAVEAEMLGMTHAEAGAYLLGLWQLPAEIVEAVGRHHAPEPPGAAVAAAVWEANRVGRAATALPPVSA